MIAILKVCILLCCTVYSLASQHSHIIPIEGYETDLTVLGQHVEIPETPVKVVKITKTVAVKIPVPYPVKVREKVPYPVYVSKPYPVPVPQIIHVPQTAHSKAHHENQAGDHGAFQNTHQRVSHPNHSNNAYGVTELENKQVSDSDIYNGGNIRSNQNLESYNDDHSPEAIYDSYDPPKSSGYGDSNSFESGHY